MDSKRSNVVAVVSLGVAVLSLAVALLAVGQASSVHRRMAADVSWRAGVDKALDEQIYFAANGQSSTRIDDKVELGSRGFALKVERLEMMVRALYRERGMKFEQE